MKKCRYLLLVVRYSFFAFVALCLKMQNKTFQSSAPTIILRLNQKHVSLRCSLHSSTRVSCKYRQREFRNENKLLAAKEAILKDLTCEKRPYKEVKCLKLLKLEWKLVCSISVTQFLLHLLSLALERLFSRLCWRWEKNISESKCKWTQITFTWMSGLHFTYN